MNTFYKKSDSEIMLYLQNLLPHDYLMCLTSYGDFYAAIQKHNFSKEIIEVELYQRLEKLAKDWYEWNDDIPTIHGRKLTFTYKGHLKHIFKLEDISSCINELYEYYKEERGEK